MAGQVATLVIAACPNRPYHDTLTAGMKFNFSCVVNAAFKPGNAAITHTDQGPALTSAAIPVRDDEPVYDHTGDMPEGFFIKESGEVRVVTKILFHNASPCPNLALKSPNTILPRSPLKRQRKDAEYIEGYHILISYGREHDKEN